MILTSHSSYDPQWIALQREVSLSESMLSLGLHALRNADFNHQAYYYTGFFNITIALERVYKLILESHEYSTHGGFLTDAQLKKEGHDLLKLYERTKSLTNPISKKQPASAPIPEEELKDTLTFLTDFAKKDRYYNFISLGKGGAADPVARWYRLVLQRHAQPPLTQMQKDFLDNAQAQDNNPSSFCDIHHFDECGNNLESNEQCCKAFFQAEHIQKQGTLTLFQIIKDAIQQLCSYSNLYDPETQSGIYNSPNHPRSWEELERQMSEPQPLQLPNFAEFFKEFHQPKEDYSK